MAKKSKASSKRLIGGVLAQAGIGVGAYGGYRLWELNQGLRGVGVRLANQLAGPLQSQEIAWGFVVAGVALFLIGAFLYLGKK